MKSTPTSIFAIIIGIFLLVEGIMGLSSPVVFGVFTTNKAHAMIHIVLGVLGAWLGFINRARGFCKFLGILLLAVGIMAFVPGTRELMAGLLNVNTAVACLNIVIGVAAFVVVGSENHERVEPMKHQRH